METIERVEVLRTVKFGRGREKTFFRGMILSGSEITNEIKKELAANTGTLRSLNADSVTSVPSVEIRGDRIYENGVDVGAYTSKEKEVPKTEEVKEEKVIRRAGSVSV